MRSLDLQMNAKIYKYGARGEYLSDAVSIRDLPAKMGWDLRTSALAMEELRLSGRFWASADTVIYLSPESRQTGV